VNKSLATLLAIAVAIAPVLYAVSIWSDVPETLPLQFSGTDFAPRRTGPKSELAFAVGLLATVSLGVYFLVRNIRRVDPKRTAGDGVATLTRLALGVTVFMALLNVVIIRGAVDGGNAIGRFLFPLLGLLFAFLGNQMHAVKPNYFVGFQLPWTLADDDNWRRVHRLGGKMWFWGGLLAAVLCIIVPAAYQQPVFLTATAVVVIIPTAYSFLLFKRKAVSNQ